MKPELMRPSTVAAEYDMSRRTVFRRMRDDPDFPRPVRVTSRTLLFRRVALERYFEGKREKGAQHA